MPLHTLSSTVATPLPSQGLERLQDAVDERARFPLTVQSLDEIVEGTNLERHAERLADGTYLSSLLDVINWWRGVEHALVYGRNSDIICPAPEFQSDFASMLRLRRIVFEGFMAADESTWHYLDGEDELTAGFELLKNYRIYTRFVVDLAKKIWPEVNLEWLESRP